MRWFNLPGGGKIRRESGVGPTIIVADEDTGEKFYEGDRPRKIMGIVVVGFVILPWLCGTAFTLAEYYHSLNP